MASERAFEITYTMTPWDYAAMTRSVVRRPLWRSLVVLAVWLVVVWCIVAWSVGVWNPVILVRAIGHSGQGWFFAAVVAVMLASTLFSEWLMWAISFLYYRQLASADATITMGLTEQGVEGDSSIADMKAPWATVKRAILTPKHIFLPISKRESFILPRRAFESDEQYQAAFRFAQAHIASG